MYKQAIATYQLINKTHMLNQVYFKNYFNILIHKSNSTLNLL